MTISIRASYARLAMTAMARKDIRYYLNGICVEPRAEGGAFIIGTDGHRMMAIIDADAKCEQTTILAPDQMTARHLPKVGGKGDTVGARLQLAEFSGKPALLVTDSTGQALHVQIHRPVVEGNYPPWHKVLPKFEKLKPGCDEPLNPAYVGAFMSAIQPLRLRTSTVEFYQAEKHAAVALRIPGHDNVLYMVMPIRGGEGAQAAWQKVWSLVPGEVSKRRAAVADAAKKTAVEKVAQAIGAVVAEQANP